MYRCTCHEATPPSGLCPGDVVSVPADPIGNSDVELLDISNIRRSTTTSDDPSEASGNVSEAMATLLWLRQPWPDNPSSLRGTGEH